MRVLLTTFAATSHLYNMVPMAWALHTAGHEVCLASHPDMVTTLERTGLPSFCVGRQMLDDDDLTTSDSGNFFDNLEFDFNKHIPDEMTLEYLQGVFAVFGGLVFPYSSSDATMEDMVSFALDWQPDLVLWDPYTFFGPVAAAACGAAHARMLIGLDFIARMRTVFLDRIAGQPEGVRDDPMAEWLTWTMARFGREYNEELVLGQWTIDSMPNSMRFPVDLHYVPVRYVPYNGAVAVPSWIYQPPKRDRLCLTFGVSNRDAGINNQTVISRTLEALADLDIEVIATVNSDQLGSVTEVPENVRVEEFVPLQALLPTCSAVIHHGGIGTFGTALVNGVPQLIVNSRPDNFPDPGFMARYIDSNGAGKGLECDQLSVDTLRSTIRRLVEDRSFRAGAARLRAEAMTTPSPNDIIPALERLTSEHRRDGR